MTTSDSARSRSATARMPLDVILDQCSQAKFKYRHKRWPFLAWVLPKRYGCAGCARAARGLRRSSGGQVLELHGASEYSTRRVANDDEAHDLIVAHPEVVGQDHDVRRVGLIKLFVDEGVDDEVTVVLFDILDVHGHLVADDLLVRPALDGICAPELSARVVDQGVVGEGRD